ncbi:MAG: SpoIIE family protein phosphatase [Bacteroidota bacterium]|nr:SpoIIE family protein phosphatase [Bacteroidota bacterium]
MDSNTKKRILLLNVSEEFKKTIEKTFDTCSYEVLDKYFHTDSSGKSPDLVIIGNDQNSNDSKSTDTENEIPVLYLTSEDATQNEIEKISEIELKQHAVDFIKHPVDSLELSSKVNSLLKRSDILKLYGSQTDLETDLVNKSIKVLIVDDDAYILKLFSYNFQKAGFVVKTALDGSEGFKQAKEFDPDVIISDIMMPKVDGYQFRKMVLQDPLLKTVPFVFLTAKGEDEDILSGYGLEIEDYIVKTSSPKIIIAKILAILKGQEKQRRKVVGEISQAANSLRAKVVPDASPYFQGFKIDQWHLPYKGVPGGDFLDYFPLDEDNLAVILGDVMGKKWGAWYFAFAFAGYVRSALRVVLQSATNDFSPSKLLQNINEAIYKDAKISEVFVTLSIIIIDRKNNIAKYAGAGDLPVFFKKKSPADGINKYSVELKSSEGLLLGFSPDGCYKDISMNLNSGDSIFVATDGIAEARNLEGELYGIDRFARLIGRILPEQEELNEIKKELNSFSNGRFDDDISLISIKAE